MGKDTGGGMMKKIKAFLNSIWHFKLNKFDWVIIRDIQDLRRANFGEEVEIQAFETKEDVIEYIKDYIPKIEQGDLQIFKRIKL